MATKYLALENQIILLTEYKDQMKDIVNKNHSATTTINNIDNSKNVNFTMQYVIDNFNPPPLKALPDNDMIKMIETFDNNDIVDDDEKAKKKRYCKNLAYHHNKNALVQYLADILKSIYEKDDPTQQSVWNSDIPRKNFHLMEKIDDKCLWVDDKSGIKMTTIIIRPFLKYTADLLHEQIGKIDMKNLSLLEENMDYMGKWLDIRKLIHDKILEKDICACLSPYFNLKNSQTKLLKLKDK